MNTKLNGVILVITAKKNMYYVTIKSVLSKLLDVFSLKKYFHVEQICYCLLMFIHNNVLNKILSKRLY